MKKPKGIIRTKIKVITILVQGGKRDAENTSRSLSHIGNVLKLCLRYRCLFYTLYFILHYIYRCLKYFTVFFISKKKKKSGLDSLNIAKKETLSENPQGP